MFDRLAVQPMPYTGAQPDKLGVQPMPYTGGAPDRLGVQPMPSTAPAPGGLPVQPMPPTAPMPARHPSMTFNDPQASNLAFSNPQGVQSRLWGAPTPNMSMPQAGPGGLFGLYSQGMR